LSGDDGCPWALFDWNLVKKILEDHQLSATMEKFTPEDLPFPLTDALESLLGLHPSSWHLKECADETIRRLAANGNVFWLAEARRSSHRYCRTFFMFVW
jgi:hypothetical protein